MSASPAYSLRQLIGYFFKLGYFGFGNPVVIIVGFIGYLVAGFSGACVALKI
jgi:hypothetical protein